MSYDPNQSHFPTSSSSSSYSGPEGGANGDRVQRVREGAHELVDRVADRAAAGAEQVGAVQEEWLTNTRAMVQEHPLTSVVIGAAAGILLGRILGHR